ncbi:uncharacterized protein VTP21DRAFT_9101 [Calcarisporiella thermophila]|uniref:uncharacterized protein n=1 Tax=Calcarisporiella thermophila TaxID=911321 RepID=UPI00374426D9
MKVSAFFISTTIILTAVSSAAPVHEKRVWLLHEFLNGVFPNLRLPTNPVNPPFRPLFPVLTRAPSTPTYYQVTVTETRTRRPTDLNATLTGISNPNGTPASTSNPNGTPVITSNSNNTPSNTSSSDGTPASTSNPNGTPVITSNPNNIPSNTSNSNGTPASTSNPNGTPVITSNPNNTPSNTSNPNGTPASTSNPNGTPVITSNPNGTPTNFSNGPSTTNQSAIYPTVTVTVTSIQTTTKFLEKPMTTTVYSCLNNNVIQRKTN